MSVSSFYKQVRENKAGSDVTLLHEISCDHAEDLVEELLPTRASWLHSQPCNWWFRGQADARWTLRPKVFRDAHHSHGGKVYDIPEIMRWVPGQVQSPRPEPYEHAAREQELVFQYCNGLERMGLTIPFDSPAFRNTLHEDPSPSEFPPVDFRWMFALAQHYGIPTRLLDWTSKPLVAAYFAAVEIARERCELPSSDKSHLAVWAINVSLNKWYRSLDPGIELMTAPAVSNPNLHAQGGAFTLVRFLSQNEAAVVAHPPDLDLLLSELDPVAAEQSALKDRTALPALVRIRLPCTEARTLLRLLDEYGVSAAHVYPGHRGAAKALLERKWMQWGAPPGERG